MTLIRRLSLSRTTTRSRAVERARICPSRLSAWIASGRKSHDRASCEKREACEHKPTGRLAKAAESQRRFPRAQTQQQQQQTLTKSDPNSHAAPCALWQPEEFMTSNRLGAESARGRLIRAARPRRTSTGRRATRARRLARTGERAMRGRRALEATPTGRTGIKNCAPIRVRRHNYATEL